MLVLKVRSNWRDLLLPRLGISRFMELRSLMLSMSQLFIFLLPLIGQRVMHLSTLLILLGQEVQRGVAQLQG